MSQPRIFPCTDLYGVTASEFSHGRSNPEVVEQMLRAGVRVVQYREKQFSMLRKYQECLDIRRLCTENNACFIVNDDVDLALAVGADGVHIGQDDLPPEVVRRLVGEEMLLGLSVTTPEQADRAVRAGAADYLGAGPIYATSTKQDACSPVGLGLLDYIAGHYAIPVVAIGGIKRGNVAEVVRHGAACVAMITDIVGAPDIGSRIAAIREEIAKSRH